VAQEGAHSFEQSNTKRHKVYVDNQFSIAFYEQYGNHARTKQIDKKVRAHPKIYQTGSNKCRALSNRVNDLQTI
jgi:hypothetical protein